MSHHVIEALQPDGAWAVLPRCVEKADPMLGVFHSVEGVRIAVRALQALIDSDQEHYRAKKVDGPLMIMPGLWRSDDPAVPGHYALIRTGAGEITLRDDIRVEIHVYKKGAEPAANCIVLQGRKDLMRWHTDCASLHPDLACDPSTVDIHILIDTVARHLLRLI